MKMHRGRTQVLVGVLFVICLMGANVADAAAAAAAAAEHPDPRADDETNSFSNSTASDVPHSLRAARVPRDIAPHLTRTLRYHEVLSASDVSHVHVRSRRSSASATSEHHTVRFSAHGRLFHLRLLRNHAMFAHGIRARVIGEDGTVTPFRVDEENYLIGHDVSDGRGSHANIYMRDGILSGFMHVDNETFFIERGHQHYPRDTGADMLVYRAADVRTGDWRRGLNATGHSFCGADHDHMHHQDHVSRHGFTSRQNNAHAHNHHSPHYNHSHDGHDGDSSEHSFPPLLGDRQMRARARRAAVSETQNTCLVAVVADGRFHTFHNNERADTTQAMLQHFSVANGVFSSTTFAADLPKGLSLFVHDVTINTNPGFVSAASVTEMLSDFSTAIDFSSSCVAHLFTRVDFSGGTLGLAWVGSPDGSRAGGICHESNSQWLNTGLTSNINFGENVPFATTALVTAHEVGHNWGAQHDDPEDTTCAPSSSDDGKYLMFAVAVDGSESNNDVFSPCSREQIAAVLRAKGTCFSTEPAGVCGNGKVESDPSGDGSEECDAGGQEDDCCNSACELKTSSGASTQCTSLNNICCDGSTCSFYPDNTHQCYEPFDLDPLCRGVGSCVGGACEDPLPPKPAGSPCSNGGRCQEVANPEQRCITFCERFGATQCTCDGGSECRLCCTHDTSANCTAGSNCGCPFQAFGDMCMRATDVVTQDAVPDPECYADDPTDPANTRYEDNPILQPCTEEDPDDCLRILNQAPGTPCSQGQCNRNGQCERTSGGTARFWDPNNFSLNTIKVWARNNIVGVVIIIALLVWIPCGLLIKRYDHKQREVNPTYGTRRTATTMRRKRHPNLSRSHPANSTNRRRRRRSREQLSNSTDVAAAGRLRPRRGARSGPPPDSGLGGAAAGRSRRRKSKRKGSTVAATDANGGGGGASAASKGARSSGGGASAAKERMERRTRRLEEQQRPQRIAAHDKPQQAPRQRRQQQQPQKREQREQQQQQQKKREQEQRQQQEMGAHERMQRRQQRDKNRLEQQAMHRRETGRMASSANPEMRTRVALKASASLSASEGPQSRPRQLPSNPPPYSPSPPLHSAPSQQQQQRRRQQPRAPQQRRQGQPTFGSTPEAVRAARAKAMPVRQASAPVAEPAAYPRYEPGAREPVAHHASNGSQAAPSGPRRIVARGVAASVSGGGDRGAQRQQHAPSSASTPRRHVIPESTKGKDLVFK